MGNLEKGDKLIIKSYEDQVAFYGLNKHSELDIEVGYIYEFEAMAGQEVTFSHYGLVSKDRLYIKEDSGVWMPDQFTGARPKVSLKDIYGNI